ncbi:PREDICTED: protein sprint-like [Priapulus caudatus]|uniref:Protein sprint-like n=1 Tax=Priapulus caudatus TaxID=37621 RepID=A0ABM1FAV8_PRICU|nr:PREDICTED: protein sprint-like [Priapulus caudatus]
MLSLRRKTRQSSKIKDYVHRLSYDPKTMFGLYVENFIQCTIEGAEKDPIVVMRNVRQFMNGIKNYLIKHGEGDLQNVIEKERKKLPPNEFLNIDAILEGVMHRIVIRPLKQHVYQCFVDEYSHNGSLALLSVSIKYARTLTTQELGIKSHLKPPGGLSLELIKQYLAKLQKTYSPLKKLENLLGAANTIYETVINSCDQGRNITSMGADAVEAAGVCHTGGKQAGMHAQQSKSGDVAGYLRVMVPNEMNDTIVHKTLPVRPHTTAKEISKMLAHKLRITNPQDFALYRIVDGIEQRLDDLECPQEVRQGVVACGGHCAFGYRRNETQIGWPNCQS